MTKKQKKRNRRKVKIACQKHGLCLTEPNGTSLSDRVIRLIRYTKGFDLPDVAGQLDERAELAHMQYAGATEGSSRRQHQAQPCGP